MTGRRAEHEDQVPEANSQDHQDADRGYAPKRKLPKIRSSSGIAN